MGEYLFPYEKIDRGSNVVIWGAGNVCRDYLFQLHENNYCNIKHIVSSDYKKNQSLQRFGVTIENPEILHNNLVYDYIIIATIKRQYIKEITDSLMSYGYSRDKIIFGNNKSRSNHCYSQHGEDMMIYNAFVCLGYFKDGKLPTYIDVGAHDPYDISNTALFYERGCNGINIEANPDLIQNFFDERPDDINICCGIGGDEGELPFYITDNPGLNTFKKDNLIYNEWLNEQNSGQHVNYDIKKTIKVRVRTLPSVIEEYCEGKWPDFMSIDIEGMEYDALKICDFTNGPKIIAVEVNYDGDLFINMMRDKNYFPYIWYRENIIFARDDVENLLHAHTAR